MMESDSPRNHGSAGIDESLYSRQLYVLGVDGMKRMARSNVLIVGLKGLGVEVAKNVALAGVRSITLYDPAPAELSDLSSQFFLRRDDIGKPRASATLPRLAELNSYVPVKEVPVASLTSNLHLLSDFDIVVLTNTSLEDQLVISDYCRANDIRLIIVQSFGLFGSVFVDLGDNFICYDATGKDPVKGPVDTIFSDGLVTCPEGLNPELEDGDYVVFSGVGGMEALNDGQPRKVTLIKNRFSIGDVSGLGTHTGGGTYTQVKVPFKVPFKSLRDQLTTPSILPSDFAKMDNPQQLHFGFQALHSFAAKNGRLPQPHDDADAKDILQLTRDIVQTSGQDVKLDENLIKELSFQARGDLCPVNSILGSFAAQEVIKAVTGKFNPLSQYLYFDAIEALPESSERSVELCAPIGSRYDSQIAVFGREFQQKLANSKHFLVGSGAIGCEMLKVWAMMGLATGPDGSITVTDLDQIEKSNLNRQFLFRPHDLNKMKSECAARAVQEMNPELNKKIIARQDPVGPDTENIFNQDFWEPLTSVTNALDNIEARRYVDERCVAFGKPLVDSGTSGMLGNVQVVVPFLTENYSHTQDAPQASIPLCTLRSFPFKIDHTIGWAKHMFTKLFHDSPTMANNYIHDFTIPDSGDDLTILEEALKTLQSGSPTIETCIMWARSRFEEFFVNSIAQLLHAIPLDRLASDNITPFWSPPKRAPHVLKFDPKDPEHALFIESATLLCAEVFNVPTRGVTTDYILKVASCIKIEEFVPAENVKVATTDAEVEATQTSNSDIVNRLPDRSSFSGVQLSAIEFEKDDATNHHIDFIASAANLRASNYDIETVDALTVKRIAGNIIPAIATTTALVTGLANIELLKIIDGKKNIEKYKNGYINLGLPLVAFSEPGPTVETKYVGMDGKDYKFDRIWKKIEFDDCLLGNLFDSFKQDYGLAVSSVVSGSAVLYGSWAAQRHAPRLSQLISELHVSISKKPIPEGVQTLSLTVTFASPNDDDDLDEDEDVDLPAVTIRLTESSVRDLPQ